MGPKAEIQERVDELLNLVQADAITCPQMQRIQAALGYAVGAKA